MHVFHWTVLTHEECDKPGEASGATRGSDQKGSCTVKEVREEADTGKMGGEIQHSLCRGTPWRMDCCQSSAE